MIPLVSVNWMTSAALEMYDDVPKSIVEPKHRLDDGETEEPRLYLQSAANLIGGTCISFLSGHATC
jgi:hypothetical protein